MKTSSSKLLKNTLLLAGVAGAAWVVWKNARSSPLKRYFVGQLDQRGLRVREAQRLLSQLGYDVPVTGIDGPRTQEAVKRFQSLHDLNITGVVDRETIAALHVALSRRMYTGFGPMASGALTPASIGS